MEAKDSFQKKIFNTSRQEIQPVPGNILRLADLFRSWRSTLRDPFSFSSFSGFDNPLAGFSLLILEVTRSHTMTQRSR
jgi:hypothetical protein